MTSHTHKSMLLRGVKLPDPVLDRSDKEILKGKASRGGRSYGGVPLNNSGRSNYDGRRDQINYGPGGSYTRQDRSDRPPYNSHNNGYNSRDSYPVAPPPPAWIPPPPGYPGFGVGVPPPPPPGLQAPPGRDGYGGNYGWGQGPQERYGSAGPAPRGNYSGQPYRSQSNYEDRSYQGYDNRGRNHRGGRGYR